LSPKATPDSKSALGPVEIRETAGNNYDSDIIVVNISRSENKGGETQELAEYTRAT
jgi:hypothetical protein